MIQSEFEDAMNRKGEGWVERETLLGDTLELVGIVEWVRQVVSAEFI